MIQRVYQNRALLFKVRERPDCINAPANVTNFGLPKTRDSVPDKNIGKYLEELCIRRGNLKNSIVKKVQANLKKTDRLNLFL